MDYYHSADVFTRRILNKPKTWREYFVNDKYTSSQQKYKDAPITKTHSNADASILNNINKRIKHKKYLKTSIKLDLPRNMHDLDINNKNGHLKTDFIVSNAPELIKVKMYNIGEKFEPQNIVITKTLKNIDNKFESAEKIIIDDKEVPLHLLNQTTLNNQPNSETYIQDITSPNKEYGQINSTTYPNKQNILEFVQNIDSDISEIKDQFELSPISLDKSQDEPNKNSNVQLDEINNKTDTDFIPINEKTNQSTHEHLNISSVSNTDMIAIQSLIENRFKKQIITNKLQKTSNSSELSKKINSEIVDHITRDIVIDNNTNNNQLTGDLVLKDSTVNGDKTSNEPSNPTNRKTDMDNTNNEEIFLNDERFIERENISMDYILQQKCNQTSRCEDSTFDNDEFLKVALGDEFALYATSNSNLSVMVEDSHANIQHSINPCRTADNSIHTSDASTLLSFAFSNCTNNTQYSIFDKEIDYLGHRTIVEKQQMEQLCKYLTCCDSNKIFSSSDQEREAERQLILSQIRYRAFSRELNHYDYEEKLIAVQSCLGTVNIENIIIPLKSVKLKYHLEEWYFLVVSSGTQIIGTPMQQQMDCKLQFNENITLTKLQPDFIATVRLFSTDYITKNDTSDLKINFNKKFKYFGCPSTWRYKDKHRPRLLSSTGETINKERSDKLSFQEIACYDITSRNIFDTNMKTLKVRSKHLNLEGTISFALQTSIDLNIKHKGFLTLTRKTNSIDNWERVWCVLDEHLFKYWNYPSDEDVKPPIGEINLKNCVSSWISQVNRELCPRPKTLLLEIINEPDQMKHHADIRNINQEMIQKYLLTADNKNEIVEWAQQLNNVISSLRHWNLLNIHTTIHTTV